MPRSRREIIGGVDTHSATHHAAVIDHNGRLLGDQQFPGGQPAIQRCWPGCVDLALSEALVSREPAPTAQGWPATSIPRAVTVLEVPRPDRRLRRQHGKNDRLDAEAAARTVLAGKASGVPKLATGPIEAIRMLRIARLGAIKAKTAATNTLNA